MRAGVRKALNVVAILAIALHTALWAGALPSAGAAVDPFSVICHSGGPAADAQAPDAPAQAPSKACDHCSLCATTAAGVPPDVVLAGRFLPVRVLAELRPASVARHDGLAANSKLARGPPQQA